MIARLRAYTAGPGVLAAVALAVWTLALFPEVLTGRVFFERDIQSYWYPQVATFARVVRSGAWPVWDPDESFGVPMLADPSSQVFYPVPWLSLLVSPETCYVLTVLGHVWATGLGAFLLARRGLGPRAAALAAATWCSAGPLLSLVSMTPHFTGACWIPWVLLALERMLEAPSARRAVALGAVAAAQSLAGSADMCVMAALLGGLRCAALVAERGGWRAVSRLALLLAVAAAFAVSLAAPQWLPALEVLRSSSRVTAGGQHLAWSLHPLCVLDLVVPRLTTDLPMRAALRQALFDGREPFLQTLYLGLAPAALAALALCTGRRAALWAGGGAAFFVLLALGRHAGPMAWVLAVPPFSVLRYPVKYTIGAAACVAALVGLGARHWSSAWSGVERGRARLAAAAVGACAAAAFAAALVLRARAESLLPLFEGPNPAGLPLAEALLGPVVRLIWHSGAVAAAAALLLALRSRVERAARWQTALGVSLVLLDAGRTGYLANRLAPPALALHTPPLVSSLAPGSRLWVTVPSLAWRNTHIIGAPPGFSREWAFALGSEQTLSPPIAARWGFRGSYDGDPTGLARPEASVMTETLARYRGTALWQRLLRMGAVDSVVATGGSELPLGVIAEEPTLFGEPVRSLRVEDPLPEAYVAAGVRAAPSIPEALAAFAAADFDPRLEVVLASAAGSPLPPSFGGSASVASRRADAWDVDVWATAPAHLVVVQGYDAGWRAWVDGAPARVEPANLLFQAVAVPAGRHRVSLRYRPRALWWGACASALAAAVGLVLAAGSALERRAGRAYDPLPR